METPSCVVLVGPMGVGKTTVGRLLAARLNSAFVDSDAVIESRKGRSGREIAESSGVERLHQMEAEVVRRVLRAEQPLVVAAAASVADQRSLLAAVRDAGGVVVYLDASRGALGGRRETGHHRRSLDDSAATRLAACRLRNTEQNGGVVVDTDGVEPAEVVTRILAQITR